MSSQPPDQSTSRPRFLSDVIAERKQNVIDLEHVLPQSSQQQSQSRPGSKLKIHTALDAFERKMAELISAVSVYEPATNIAKELLEADVDLSVAVDELKQYHSNSELIAQLRETSDALDAQSTKLLSSLADARAQLLAIPDADVIDADSDRSSKKIPYTELLAYATKIAKFSTAPPGFAPPAAWAPPETDKSPPLPPDHVRTAEEIAKETIKMVYAAETSSVPAKLPWPTEDEMRRGVLAQFNRMSGRGDGVVATEMTVVVPGEGTVSDAAYAVETVAPPTSRRRRRRHRQRNHNGTTSDNDGDNSDDEDDEEDGDDDDSSFSDYADAQENASRANGQTAATHTPTPAPTPAPVLASTPEAVGNGTTREATNHAAFLDLDLFDPDDD
ncbi:vitamin-D-receptor interacting mediator subunit 4-domain-containing protein [Lipomyces arxii]|uniref:vitamin-D-receptor interacting mediator subunit 4-domain-containing protein n=1 Tax=Lipomyces arxii TaxID=56418 RepID=UPI0034CE170D